MIGAILHIGFQLFTASQGAASSLLYMRAPSSHESNKYTLSRTAYTFPVFSPSLSRARLGDGLSTQATAAAAVPMRKQSPPRDRSPRAEAALGTAARLTDERVMLVFLLLLLLLLLRSARSVALRSAVSWDTAPPSMALLSLLRSRCWMAAGREDRRGERALRLRRWSDAPHRRLPAARRGWVSPRLGLPLSGSWRLLSDGPPELKRRRREGGREGGRRGV